MFERPNEDLEEMISESSLLISGRQFATTLGIGTSATAICLEEGYRLDDSTARSIGYVVGIATILVTACYIAQRYLSRRNPKPIK